MGMSKWECDEKGCTATAVGSGGGVGLRAIGWWFVPGPRLLCPVHRPDPTPCHQAGNSENAGRTCATCTAEAEADQLQEVIRAVLRMPPGPRPLFSEYEHGDDCHPCSREAR